MKKLVLTIVAGLLSVSLYAQDNESFIQQVWDNNLADVKQQGEWNTAHLYQTGNAWNTYRNEAFVNQIGEDNWVGLDQYGEGNRLDATQKGHDNYVGGVGSDFAYQNGYMNSIKVEQDGYDHVSMSSQNGSNNYINVYQYDHDQYSTVVQFGTRNGANVLQRN